MKAWVIRFDHQADGRAVYWRGKEPHDLDYSGDVRDALKFTTLSGAAAAIADELDGVGVAVEVEV